MDLNSNKQQSRDVIFLSVAAKQGIAQSAL